MSNQETIHEEKYASIAYLLWGLGFVGICGLHRMYLGQYQLGTAMLLTFGLCGVGQLVDVVVIPKAVRETNGKDESSDKASPAHRAEPVPIRATQPEEDLDELDLEQASIEETMKKLRD